MDPYEADEDDQGPPGEPGAREDQETRDTPVPPGPPAPRDVRTRRGAPGPSAGPVAGARVRAPGIGGLSLPYRVAAALALGTVAVVACTHVVMVFLHVAPSNTVTKQHGEVVGDWIYPEFEQNWKLFAPNPLQQNVAVEARAEVRAPDGELRLSGWQGLSAQDGAAIEGNPLPSHTDQNELRRAWDFYAATHDVDDESPGGLRSELADRYLHRIALMRLAARAPEGGEVTRVQLRVRTTTVAPPRWSEEKVNLTPSLRRLDWWTVPARDADLAAGRGRGQTLGRGTEPGPDVRADARSAAGRDTFAGSGVVR